LVFNRIYHTDKLHDIDAHLAAEESSAG